MADKPDSAEPDSVEGGRRTFKPVLGLSDEPGEPLAIPARAGTVYDQPEPDQLIELTVIIPARNEELNLAACNRSSRNLKTFSISAGTGNLLWLTTIPPTAPLK